MISKSSRVSLLVGIFFMNGVFADGHDACLKCHEGAEFAGLSAAEVGEDLRDPGIPPHKKFADLSDEQIQALIAELAKAP